MLNIKTPTLVLDLGICRQNIRQMNVKANESKAFFRPHFKTHQSAAIGEWFREEGISAITVSSVSMAEYFANHSWKDITIAFPVNLLELDKINELASRIQINLLVESEETANFLSKKLLASCGFFIKIDTGYHRTGIDSGDIVLIDKVLKSANPAKLHFKGFLTHSGNSYHAKNKAELQQISQHTTNELLKLKKKYQAKFPNLILSVGDTPTCSQLQIPEGIDEIRPGNFVFYDVMQFALGSCLLENIAVALVCPVVAIHTNRSEAVIYGGAIHLSKEHASLLPYPGPIFGLAVSWDGNKWDTGNLLGFVKALSQEHGIIKITKTDCRLKPGDLVAILPVHSCLTGQLMRKYYTLDGEVIETLNS
jgi:D-serine deaminase-like pyridoxal phosphate-dependent protein